MAQRSRARSSSHRSPRSARTPATPARRRRAEVSSARLSQQDLACEHRSERDRDRHDEQRHRRAILAELHQVVDRRREHGRAAGNVAGHEDGGAELAEGARERDYRAGDDPARGERQRDREEDARLRRAERPCDLFISAADLLERDARGANEKREGHHRHRQRYGAPGEDDVDSDPMQRRAEESAAAEELEKDEPCRNRRHHQRQRHERLHERLSAPRSPRQQPGYERPRQEQQRRRQKRHLDREENHFGMNPYLAKIARASLPPRNSTKRRASFGDLDSRSTAAGYAIAGGPSNTMPGASVR